MKTFEISVGQSRRLLRLEPTVSAGSFNLYAANPAEDWIDYEQARSADIPGDGKLGTITVHGEKRFEFEGLGIFTGQELESMAAQIVLHPQFKAAETGGTINQ